MRMAQKERCEPEYAHSLHVGSGLTRVERISLQLTPPTYMRTQHKLQHNTVEEER